VNGPARLSGTVEHVIFRNPRSGYAVLRVRPDDRSEPVVLVGSAAALEPGDRLAAEGAWHDDRSWGRQFRAERLEAQPTTTLEGLRAYLATGAVKGVGPALADRLVTTFGAELPEIIATDPYRLTEIDGIGAVLAARIHEAWQEQRDRRELLVFLQGHGLGPGRALRVVEALGQQAMARIAADPFTLAREVPGIGFHQADLFAKGLGVAADAPARLAAALAHALVEAQADGHAAMLRAALIARAAALTAVEPGAVAAVLDAEVTAGRLIARPDEDGELIFPPALDRAEEAIARRLARLARTPARWAIGDPAAAIDAAERRLGLRLADAQRAAIEAALRHRLVVITGGPGTGKTTLLRALLMVLEVSAAEILLAAPTGRAARRLGEQAGGIARTLHRLLEADPTRGFARNAQRPLHADLVVVDEASMLDLALTEALLAALPADAALLLVGDVDQLPSIGPGQVLADIIDSGVACVVRLDEIFRQAARSRIVTNAHRINAGAPLELARDEDAVVDFYAVRARDPQDAADKVVELASRRVSERFGFDPRDEIQVLTPVNRGRTGTRALNERLQAVLNPEPAARVESRGGWLAPGDKVMQTENDYEREVYNGDIGVVVAVDPRGPGVDVAFEQRIVRYPGEALDALVPAYAVTVHKAQGSEYPAVVMPLSREHGRMLRRDLLYTAITRARRLVVLVAEPEALERALNRTGDRRRRSLLRRRLIRWSEELAAHG
jgi:exodeoxyribonuclease V alpha subunit